MSDPAKAFARLQKRLLRVWRGIESGEPAEHTSIIVPSLSFDQDELEKIQGISYYEERLLFSLIRLRDPRARVIYVTSQPLHPEIIDYYVGLLRGMPQRVARSRLLLIALNDSSPRPLTQKILERPRVIRRLRAAIGDSKRAYLTVFNTTVLERELALRLDVPLNGVDPELSQLGTKIGSREVFALAGVAHPAGIHGVRTRTQIAKGLYDLRRDRPYLKRAVIKLDESFAGAGNAIFRFPGKLEGAASERRRRIAAALDRIELNSGETTRKEYLAKLRQMGGVVEELVEARGLRSPSVQVRINPDRSIQLLSSHEQVLGGPLGQTYLGCRFPADGAYRATLQGQATRVAEILRDRGVVGRFAVDFIVWPSGGGWDVLAIEINLRMGGTTAPFLALQFLTGGDTDEETGLFRAADGTEKYYFATDNLRSPRYHGMLPEDFTDILARRELLFDPTTETGPVFHMIGALSQYGKVGVTCIANSPQEASEIYEQVVGILDEEGAGGLSGTETHHPYELPIAVTISRME